MILFREKQLESFKHSLLVRRIIYDKIVFGFILLSLGALGGFSGNKMLENHRSELLKERFLLEKRLESVLNIRSEYSKFLMFLNECVIAAAITTFPKDYNNQYVKMLKNLALRINIESLLLSVGCMEKAQNHILILNGLTVKGVDQSYKYMEFFMDVSSCFDSLLRREMGQAIDDSSSEFKISDIKREQILKTGIEKYFDQEYERWKKWKQKI